MATNDDAAEFSAERDKLLNLKEELTQRLDGLSRDAREPLDKDFAEQAVELENRDVMLALGDEARIELVAIERALQRIQEGIYGDCLSCGEPIARARLAAFPAASQCITCADR